MDLIELIEKYYEKRNLKYPDTWESLGWATAELGEVYEVLLAQKGGWVRNNPENHTKFTDQDLEEELGDVIMMVMMAGYTRGLNPIQALKDKINRKLEKLKDEKRSELDDEIEASAKEYWETYTDAKADDEYDYVQDDLNFDASRERQHK